MTIEGSNGWYMNRCKTCSQRIEDISPHWHCQPPGTPVIANYSYCLRAIIADVTASISVSCYSPEAHSFLPAITELLSYVPDRDPYTVPPIIKDLENTTHRFVLHFGKGSRKRSQRFILDEATDTDAASVPPAPTVGRLPALPAPTLTLTGTCCSPTNVTGREETGSAEILVETMTPPPPSTESAKKVPAAPETGASSVRKQLFQTSEDENASPAANKAKKDERDPKE